MNNRVIVRFLFFNADNSGGQPRSRGAGGAIIYGKVVHKAPAGSRLRNGMPNRMKAFEEVSRLYGTVNRQMPDPRRRLTNFRVGGGGGSSSMSQVPQAGSFQHLKELVRTERARELQVRQRRVLCASYSSLGAYPFRCFPRGRGWNGWEGRVQRICADIRASARAIYRTEENLHSQIARSPLDYEIQLLALSLARWVIDK